MLQYMHMASKSLKVGSQLAGIISLLLVGSFIYLVLLAPPIDTQESAPAAPPSGPVEARGEIICLPHRDTRGPQTMECAFGMRDTDGRQFSLVDTDPEYKNISSAPHGVEVIVRGVFTLHEDTRYESMGIIEVESIQLADVPQRMSITGTYLCLPHKDTSGAQTDECATGIQTDDGLYYGLDLSLSSQTMPELTVGDRLSANGVMIPIEQLSTDHWQQYPIVGIFSVTDWNSGL